MKIITTPDARLREKSEKVREINDEIRRVIADMRKLSLDWEAKHPFELSAAMAAPQMGVLKRIIIIRDDMEDKKNASFTALINPEVIKELLDEHLIDYIAMDIKTVFSKYSEVANRKVDIDALRNSIELIKNSNIDYEFRTTVVKAFVSYEDLVFILDYLNCKKYYLQKFEDRQSNIVYHLEAFSDDELKDIYSKLKEKYDFIKIRGLR